MADMSKKRKREDRSGEFQKRRAIDIMKKDDKTWAVWMKLQGKSKVMQQLQTDFLKDFQEKGYEAAEGSKWKSHLQQDKKRRPKST